MSHPDELLDTDFEAQLRGLFQQAERAIEGRAAVEKQATDESNRPTQAAPAANPPVAENPAAAPAPVGAPTSMPAAVATPPIAPAASPVEPTAGKGMSLSLPQMLKPVVLGLEAVSRATTENTSLLKRLDTAANNSAEAGKQLPAVVADLRALVDSKNGLSQSMFTALHEELKGYKDGFLLDSVHRPIIRDLISLYDDTAEIHRQVAAAIAEAADKDDAGGAGLALLDRIRTIEMNLEHHMEFIAEVLNRLEVNLVAPHTGKLDKQTQRAVSVEMAEDPDEDGNVVRAVKRGFVWKERTFRAEEVVIKKWKEGFLMAMKTETKQ